MHFELDACQGSVVRAEKGGVQLPFGQPVNDVSIAADHGQPDGAVELLGKCLGEILESLEDDSKVKRWNPQKQTIEPIDKLKR